MKKGLTVGIVLLAVGATALIIFLNKKSATTKGTQAPIEQIEDTRAPSGETSVDATAPSRTPNSEFKAEPLNIAEEKREFIRSYLDHSGFNKAIDFIETEMAPMFEGMLNDPSISDQEKEAMRRFLEKMRGDVLSNEYQRLLNEKFSKEQLQKIDQIFQDPTVQEFTAEQQRMMMPENEADYFNFLDRFDPKKLSDDRRESLNKLVEVQLKSLPKDMFGDAIPDMDGVMAAARDEMMSRIAYAGRNMSSDQIKELTKKISDEDAIRASQEQVRMIMNFTKESIDALSP